MYQEFEGYIIEQDDNYKVFITDLEEVKHEHDISHLDYYDWEDEDSFCAVVLTDFLESQIKR